MHAVTVFCSGDIVSRITTDTNTMSESLSEKLSLLMWYFMRVIFLFGSMLLLSTRLSVFTALGLPIIWIIPEFSGQFYQVRLIYSSQHWSVSKNFIKVVLRQKRILVLGFRTTLMKGFDPLQMLISVYLKSYLSFLTQNVSKFSHDLVRTWLFSVITFHFYN